MVDIVGQPLTQEEINALGLGDPVVTQTPTPTAFGAGTLLTDDEISSLGLTQPTQPAVAPEVDPLLQTATQRPLSAAEQDRLAGQAIRGITPSIQETVTDIATIPGAIKRAITGEERTTAETDVARELFTAGFNPEFTFADITNSILNAAGGRLDSKTGAVIELGKQLFAATSEGKVNILKQNNPDLTTRTDEKGNLFVTLTPGGEEFVVNRPGASPSDAVQLAFDALLLIPAAFAGGPVVVGITSALTDFAQQIGGQFLGSQEELDKARLLFTGIGGFFGKKLEKTFTDLTADATETVTKAGLNREARQEAIRLKLQERTDIVDAGELLDVDIRTSDVLGGPISQKVKSTVDKGGLLGGQVVKNQKQQLDDAVELLIDEQKLTIGDKSKLQSTQGEILKELELAKNEFGVQVVKRERAEITLAASTVGKDVVKDVADIFFEAGNIIANTGFGKNTPGLNRIIQDIVGDIPVLQQTINKLQLEGATEEGIQTLINQFRVRLRGAIDDVTSSQTADASDVSSLLMRQTLNAANKNAKEQVVILRNTLKNGKINRAERRAIIDTIDRIEGRLVKGVTPVQAGNIIITDITGMLDDALAGLTTSGGGGDIFRATANQADILRPVLSRLLANVQKTTSLNPLNPETRAIIKDQIQLTLDTSKLTQVNKTRILDNFEVQYDNLVKDSRLIPFNESKEAVVKLTNIIKQLETLQKKAIAIDKKRKSIIDVGKPTTEFKQTRQVRNDINNISTELTNLSSKNKKILDFTERSDRVTADIIKLVHGERSANLRLAHRKALSNTFNKLPKANQAALRKIIIKDFLENRINLKTLKDANADFANFMQGPGGVLFKGVEGGKLKGLQKLIEVISKSSNKKLNAALRESDSILNTIGGGGVILGVLGTTALSSTLGVAGTIVSVLLRAPRLYESNLIRKGLVGLSRLKDSNAIDIAVNELIPKINKAALATIRVGAKTPVTAAAAKQINTTNDIENNN